MGVLLSAFARTRLVQPLKAQRGGGGKESTWIID